MNAGPNRVLNKECRKNNRSQRTNCGICLMSPVTCRPFIFSNTTTKGLCCTEKTVFYVTWHKSRSKIKVLWQQRQQRHSSSVSRTLNGNLFAITQIISIPRVKTLMARKSPRLAEPVIKAESQTTQEECDAGFINLKVKQQVFFIIFG